MKAKMTKTAAAKKTAPCKVNCSYPTGTTPSAKVSMSAQKTNPARRNRNY